MLNIGLLIIGIPAVCSLTCASLYDYTGASVTCKTACPPNSLNVSNNCLLPNQYMQAGEVHVCQRGWTNSARTLCCPEHTSILAYNGADTCEPCHGTVYQMGAICCPGSSYADLTGPPVCKLLKTGPCPSLGMQSPFKVCCGANSFYHLQLLECGSASGQNCDPAEKVCCGAGQMLEYLQGVFQCVATCSWGKQDSFYCRKQYCDSKGVIKRIGPVRSILAPQPLLSFNGDCCYGSGPTGNCLVSPNDCQVRFLNRGWSVCCKFGQFYDVAAKTCTDTCGGHLVYQFLCVSTASMVGLQREDGVPTMLPLSSLCNGRPVSPEFPVCCPSGFYIAGSDGCQFCSGRVHLVGFYQVCCPYNSTFNQATHTCQQCEGVTDPTGTVCCDSSQYVSYTSSGLPSCVDTCANDYLYNGAQACCQSSSTSQCQIASLQPTTCNPSYFLPQACQVCPTLCSTQADLCTASSQTGSCQEECGPATVFTTDISECLSCDPSCAECSQPFSPTACLSCQVGYVNVQAQCAQCHYHCRTCAGTTTQCTSCFQNSSMPILSQGDCIQDCGSSAYWNSDLQTCMDCPSTCLQCASSSTTQCTQCLPAFYLTGSAQGACNSCPSTCKTCQANLCYLCSSPTLVLSQNVCGPSCPTNYLPVLRPWLQHRECVRCHSSCLSCSGLPSNCTACPSSGQFLQDSLGVYLCSPCASPCATCTSQTLCTTCLPSYYLSVQSCLPCHSSCATCSGPSKSQCLTCIGVSQLVEGTCIACSSICSKCDVNQNCVECQSPYFLYNGNCAASCPIATYPLALQCQDCLTNCSACTNATACLACSSSHPIEFDGKCLSGCPVGYELQQTSCVVIINPLPITCLVNCSTCATATACLTCSSSHPVQFDGKCLTQCPTGYQLQQNTCIINQNNTNNTNNTPEIESQIIEADPVNKEITIQTFFVDPVSTNTSLEFFFIDKKTSRQTKLRIKEVLQRSPIKLQATTTSLKYLVEVPPGVKVSNQVLKTNVLQNGQPGDSTYLSSQSLASFLFYDYQMNPLQGLQYIGLGFTILILIYAIASKLKSHFLAEESNTLILHMMGFIQAVYLFKFTRVHPEGMYHFLNGFGFMHILFWPNFFYSAIPPGYREYPAETSLIPDANFLRNAGSSISYALVVLVVLIIAMLVSLLLFKKKFLPEMPQIRKITRVGILLLHLTFMNILFTSFTYLIQPYVPEPPATPFQQVCTGFSVFFPVFIPCAALSITYHFYKTYNSDVLEHYYTLREAAHYALIFTQAFIFCFSIGKPLVCLFLIPLEILWLLFNVGLYRYGEGNGVKDQVKLMISAACISIAYLFLSLTEQVPWVAVVAIVSVVVIVLIVYSSYQIVGLYYFRLFKKQV